MRMGYWNNIPNLHEQKYRNSSSVKKDLIEVPSEYTVIVVSYMGGEGIPTFVPFDKSDKEFREQVDHLTLKGRQVLLDLGGAQENIELQAGQEGTLAKEIMRLVDIYGFSGICLNLEQYTIEAGDNQTVIPAALKMVKDHYRNEGQDFLIALAPKFSYLREGSNYLPYLSSLEGYYDLVCTQVNTRNGDGLWIDELSKLLTLTNDEETQGDYIYYMLESLINGERGYTRISHDKLVVGLPDINDHSQGNFIHPSAVFKVAKRLQQNGIFIRGFSTSSIDWDAGSLDKPSYFYESTSANE